MTWDGLRLALLARGYRQIVWVEAECAIDGAFRGAVDPEYDSPQCPCPKCGQELNFAILARGFTRRDHIEWELASKALPAILKANYREPVVRQKAPNWHAPRSGRPMDPQTPQKIALAAELLARGVARKQIARMLFPEHTDPERLKNCFGVFLFRHRGQITTLLNNARYA